MRILILGGTVFLGRHLAGLALERGHALTLLHRGEHGAELFPASEHLLADRDGRLDVLAGRRWDVAIDTCGYVPRIVAASAEALANSVEHYTFVSTLSVHADNDVIGRTEEAAVGTLEDPTTEVVDGATYGPLKALCEQAAEAAMPGRVLVVRPGLIVGPHDPSDRFTYWPVRLARGGQVLAPEGRDAAVQFVDVRDLARWMLDLAERRTTGTFNAVGPATPLTLGTVLDACTLADGKTTTIAYASWPFLESKGVAPYMDLPLWVPDVPSYAGASNFDCAKAIRAGLTFRSSEETAADTLAWAQTRPSTHQWRAGLTPEREAELLTAWRSEGTD